MWYDSLYNRVEKGDAMREDINADYKSQSSTWEVIKLTIHYISKILLFPYLMLMLL